MYYLEDCETQWQELFAQQFCCVPYLHRRFSKQNVHH